MSSIELWELILSSGISLVTGFMITLNTMHCSESMLMVRLVISARVLALVL